MSARYETRSNSRKQSKSTGKSKSSRSSSRRGGKSTRPRSSTRDIAEIFNEFREVFDPDALSVDADRENEDLGEETSDEASGNNLPGNDRDRQNSDTPAWAKTIIDTQRKALDENRKQLSELRSEVRSLKRKRDDTDKEKSFEWKQKGNRKQYEFNRSVEEHFQDIAVSKTLLEARTSAEKGLCLITERNKLVKIADKHGWDTVNQYVTDPLAKDDADDKRLRKAIKDAEKSREKAKKEKEAKSRRTSRARAFSSGASSAFSSTRLGPPPATSTDSSRIVIAATDKKFSQAKCYRCGKPGHFSRDCLMNERQKS